MHAISRQFCDRGKRHTTTTRLHQQHTRCVVASTLTALLVVLYFITQVFLIDIMARTKEAIKRATRRDMICLHNENKAPAPNGINKRASTTTNRVVFKKPRIGGAQKSKQPLVAINVDNNKTRSSRPAPRINNDADSEKKPFVNFYSPEKWFFSVPFKAHARSDGHDKESAAATVWTKNDFTKWSRVVGKGKLGKVFFATESSTQQAVAIKRIGKRELLGNDLWFHMARREVEIHSRLHHVHILDCYGYFHDSTHLYLVLERAVCDVEHYHKKYNLDEICSIVHQVTLALSYLAHHFLAHRDLKPENVLVMDDSNDSSMVVKLADFGHAVHVGPGNAWRTTFCGTWEFLAPEIVHVHRNNNNNKAINSYNARLVDVWSLGVLTLELVLGKTPFERNKSNKKKKNSDSSSSTSSSTRDDTLDAIVGFDGLNEQDFCKEFYKRHDAKDTNHALVLDFMQKLLLMDPTRRMTPVEALHHEWLSQK